MKQTLRIILRLVLTFIVVYAGFNLVINLLSLLGMIK